MKLYTKHHHLIFSLGLLLAWGLPGILQAAQPSIWERSGSAGDWAEQRIAWGQQGDPDAFENHAEVFRITARGNQFRQAAPSLEAGQAFGGVDRRALGFKLDHDVDFVYTRLELGAAPPKRRGTLFLWNTGSGATGGPNLDEPLVTDRPDFTESGTPVGLGVTQLEFGYTYSDTSAGTAHSMGELLVRYGILAEWLELRLGLAPVSQRSEAGAARHSGTEDLYFGFKLGLTPQDGRLPEMALIPQINIPTGSDPFSSDHLEPGFNWNYGWEISNFISTGGSTQWNRRYDSGQGYLETAQSWTVAYSLTDRLGAYTEWYGMFPSGATTEHTQHYFNGGFTYLITNDIQIDIRAGAGLNDAADDFIMGVGMSFRFP
jgi:hypothetical protein